MAIGKDKTQVLLTLTKEDKAELQRIADNENRSFTNLINTIIKNYLKSQRELTPGKIITGCFSLPFLRSVLPF